MHSIQLNLRTLLADIAQVARVEHRRPASVELLAVTKTRSAAEIKQAYLAGCRHFGENYAQEALPKLAELSGLEDCHWHFIGAIQSNKTREIATHFDWVHTLDRAKIGRRLDSQRPAHRQPLNVCVQVNLHQESQKAGVAPPQLAELLQDLADCGALQLRGLMVIPAVSVEPADAFEELAQLFAAQRSRLDDTTRQCWDTLSMGMSGDYHAAISAGSTMVRIGTAIFGPRRQTRLQTQEQQ